MNAVLQSAFLRKVEVEERFASETSSVMAASITEVCKEVTKINQRPNRRLVRMWQIFWRIFHLQYAAFRAFPYLCASVIERSPSFVCVSTLNVP